MKRLALIIALTACQEQARVSTFGTINGGGGVGIRCDGKLEMLDLYEAWSSGLTIIHHPRTEQEAVQNVSSLLANHFWNPDTQPPSEVAKEVAESIVEPLFQGKPIRRPEGGGVELVTFVPDLPLSDDLGEVAVPEGCTLEQVAYYSDQDRELSISSRSWRDLDWTSRSVLAVHEFIYVIYRRHGFRDLVPEAFPETSSVTRRFVGRLFSGRLPRHSDGLPANKETLYICAGSGESASYAYVYGGPDGVSLVFNQLRGISAVYQTRADFQGVGFEQLVSSTGSIRETEAKLEFAGDPETSGLSLTIARQEGSRTFDLALYYRHPSGLFEKIGETESLYCAKFLPPGSQPNAL